jgi:glycosyltransferase involved in cell wall biosynthesis
MIPVYNRTQYLEKTLRSVLTQDPGAQEMQIEVVDDASSVDDPEPLVRRIAGDRVGFVRNPRNLGLMPNFNNCVERSRGDWVHILHTDDLVLPGFYERLKIALEARSDIGAAFCRNTFIDENEHRSGASELLSPMAGILAGFLEEIALSNRISTPAIVVRRSVYERLGGFRLDLPFAADWEMWIRIAAHYPIWYEPDTLAAFRIHSASATATFVSSGEYVADERRCIEISQSCLPPDRAEDIAKSARELLYLKALSMTSQDDAVLRLVEELIKVSGGGPIHRSAIANALLRAAHIHYRHARRLQALLLVGRAMMIGPIVLRNFFWDIFISRTFPLRKRLGLRRRISIEQDARRG